MRGRRLATSAAVLVTSRGSAPGGYLANIAQQEHKRWEEAKYLNSEEKLSFLALQRQPGLVEPRRHKTSHLRSC